MVVIDAVVRLVPGVLGDSQSAVDESFGPEGGLEYPQYTRPRVFRGRAVPEVLYERRPCRHRPLAAENIGDPRLPKPWSDRTILICGPRTSPPSRRSRKGKNHAESTC